MTIVPQSYSVIKSNNENNKESWKLLQPKGREKT